MSIVARFVGLDVHADSISIAVADGGGGEPSFLGRIPNDCASLMKQLHRLGPSNSIFTCYEAGPTGYDLHRRLTENGVPCAVIAPSLIPKKPGERVKTDRHDALELARLYRSGDLTPVWVPDEETEAMRELTRGRNMAKRIQKKARQRIDKFLLRYGRRFGGKTKWTVTYINWMRKQKFAHEASQYAYDEYVYAQDETTTRVERFDAKIRELVQRWSRQALVEAFQAFRGIQITTAAAIVSEIGDFQRFLRAPELMSYVGLTPSENSSGERTKRSGITRTGNSRVRRLLIESAWSYRMRPKMSTAIAKRNEPVSPGVSAIAWKAQQRLCNRFRRMRARGKESQKVVTAVARELAGFLWAAAREPELMAQLAAAEVKAN